MLFKLCCDIDIGIIMREEPKGYFEKKSKEFSSKTKDMNLVDRVSAYLPWLEECNTNEYYPRMKALASGLLSSLDASDGEYDDKILLSYHKFVLRKYASKGYKMFGNPTNAAILNYQANNERMKIYNHFRQLICDEIIRMVRPEDQFLKRYIDYVRKIEDPNSMEEDDALYRPMKMLDTNHYIDLITHFLMPVEYKDVEESQKIVKSIVRNEDIIKLLNHSIERILYM